MAEEELLAEDSRPSWNPSAPDQPAEDAKVDEASAERSASDPPAWTGERGIGGRVDPQLVALSPAHGGQGRTPGVSMGIPCARDAR